MDGKSIILFDGVCNFCNRTVNFLIRRDKADQFRFAPLQSETGRLLLSRHNLVANSLESFVLIETGEAYLKSTGFLRMMKKLPGGWKLLYGFIILPRFIRDGLYNWIAANRYKWFGKRNECMIPTPELRERFLE